MALTTEQAVSRARELHAQRETERRLLDEVRRYWKGRQKMPVAIPPAFHPSSTSSCGRPRRTSLTSSSRASPRASRSRVSARSARPTTPRSGTCGSGTSSTPARAPSTGGRRLRRGVRGRHGRRSRAGHPRPVAAPPDREVEGDSDWPTEALEYRPGPAKLWRLYDSELVYTLKGEGGTFEFVEQAAHGAGVCPVVRYLEARIPTGTTSRPTSRRPGRTSTPAT